MRRRLYLAMALVHEPAVIFLEEPTTGLDPASRRDVWREVRRLNRELGITIFLTTQYLEEADKLAETMAMGASFIFFPLTFLAPTFVPIELLSGWLAIAAKTNPITYVLQAMRSLINAGWDGKVIWQAVLACLLLARPTYVLAAVALRVRTCRS